MTGAAAILGWTFIVIVLGSLCLWAWWDWRERHLAADRKQMEQWFEPYQHARRHEFPSDHVIDDAT